MNIKILGTGCKKCQKLYELCNEIVAELEIEANIEKVEDLKAILGYGVMTTPGLVINEELKVSGKLPSKKAVKDIITKSI